MGELEEVVMVVVVVNAGTEAKIANTVTTNVVEVVGQEQIMNALMEDQMIVDMWKGEKMKQGNMKIVIIFGFGVLDWIWKGQKKNETLLFDFKIFYKKTNN